MSLGARYADPKRRSERYCPLRRLCGGGIGFDCF